MKTKPFISMAALCGALMTSPTFDVAAQVNDASETARTQASGTGLQVVQSKPMQFRVIFYKPQTTKIAVRIMDSKGEILYNEFKTVHANYLRYFDLSSLNDGTYTFEIVDGNEKYNQSFDIVTQTRRMVSSIK